MHSIGIEKDAQKTRASYAGRWPNTKQKQGNCYDAKRDFDQRREQHRL